MRKKACRADRTGKGSNQSGKRKNDRVTEIGHPVKICVAVDKEKHYCANKNTYYISD